MIAAGIGSPLLAPSHGPVELIQQVLEAIGNALPHHVVINPLQDVPESALVFATEASSRPSNCGIHVH